MSEKLAFMFPLPPNYSLRFGAQDQISNVNCGVSARIQNVHPHFSDVSRCLVWRNEEKLRAHHLHTGTPPGHGLCPKNVVSKRHNVLFVHSFLSDTYTHVNDAFQNGTQISHKTPMAPRKHSRTFFLIHAALARLAFQSSAEPPKSRPPAPASPVSPASLTGSPSPDHQPAPPQYRPHHPRVPPWPPLTVLHIRPHNSTGQPHEPQPNPCRRVKMSRHTTVPPGIIWWSSLREPVMTPLTKIGCFTHSQTPLWLQAFTQQFTT